MTDGADGDCPQVYLAGPVQYPPDGGHGWRDAITERYDDHGVRWANPLAQYDVPSGEVTITEGPTAGANEITREELVNSDKRMVASADAVLARYAHVPSSGTSMEMLYAHERDIPVIVWADTDATVSVWVIYHANSMYRDRAEAVADAIAYATRSKPRLGGGDRG